MSNQLAISACASVFAMAALAVLNTNGGAFAPAASPNHSGATVEAAAPAMEHLSPTVLEILQ